MSGAPLSVRVGALAQRSAALAPWLMILGIAYTLGGTLMFFIDSRQPSASLPMPAVGGARQQAVSPTDLNAILKAQLFGRREQGQAAATLAEPEAETRLPLKLMGVFVADEADQSAAIIAERGRRERLYLVGQTVPGNATLRSVHADHVVLLRAGVHEALRFPKILEFQRISPSQAPSGSAASQAFAGPLAGGRGQPDNPTSASDLVEQRRAQPGADPALLEPTPAGFRVGALADLPHFREAGLRRGDLILSLNGRSVQDMGGRLPQLSGLLDKGPVEVEVQRGERRVFLSAFPNL